MDGLYEQFIAMFLDDNFLEPPTDGTYTDNLNAAIALMTKYPDIAMIKLQAGGAHAPELDFPEWDRIREYDRRPHPFKRTNLIPTLYRRSWLLRLSKAVLANCGPERDQGRSGALEFESTGTALTADRIHWPERMFGIHRPERNGGGGRSLITCIANDAVTGGKVREIESLRSLCVGVEGIEAFL